MGNLRETAFVTGGLILDARISLHWVLAAHFSLTHPVAAVYIPHGEHKHGFCINKFQHLSGQSIVVMVRPEAQYRQYSNRSTRMPGHWQFHSSKARTQPVGHRLWHLYHSSQLAIYYQQASGHPGIAR